MNSNNKSLCIIYFLAAFVRWFLVTSEFQKDIASRIEVTTPLNSMRRVVEGRYRIQLGLDPYSSDILHESPAHLQIYIFLLNIFEGGLAYLFIFIDLMTAHLLYLFTKRYMLQIFITQEKSKHRYAIDSETQLLHGKDLMLPPLYVMVVYLFNPYSIFNCVAMTTTVLHNFLLSMFFAALVYGIVPVCVVVLTLLTTQSFYPIILVSPMYLMIHNKFKSHLVAMQISACCLILTAAVIFVTRNMLGSWEFMEHTFGFILQVADQQPNIGVYWYFFMEMFEHFRLLFLYSYQMNVTVLYFVPLTIKFRKDPALLAACFIMLITIFKSYPSAGDFGFTLALLPCWRHLYNCMQQIFISSITIIVTTALAPILWDLWIYWGTANANFFFGATLAFITAHIFLVTDVSFAYTKREYLLKYGNYRKINGKDAKLVLE